MSSGMKVSSLLFPAAWMRLARRAKARLNPPPQAPFQYPFAEALAQQPAYGRANYRWGVMCAASLAKHLGVPRISVIEFGVAGGNGLLKLEANAVDVEQISGVGIDVYGFDTGTGLTQPLDHRDLPQMWSEGHYGMDVAALRKRLKRARLVLGPVGETVPTFMRGKPAPLGFVAFDMDLYSSTMDAFRLFEDDALLLPRVTCYFDDIFGYSHGDFSGERLAISDFNNTHDTRKISKLYGLRYLLRRDAKWTEMMYMFHSFRHPQYSLRDGTVSFTEMPLLENS